MSPDNRVDLLIREAVEHGAPPPAGPGPDCPSIVSFERGVATGWRDSPALREHVSHCLYCQRMTAAVWRDSCPPRETVLWYRRDPALCPDAIAMRIHLEQHGCEHCGEIRPRSAGISGIWRAAIGIAASLLVAIVLVPWPEEPVTPQPATQPKSLGSPPVSSGSKSIGVSKGLFDPVAIDLGICAANLDPLTIPFPADSTPRTLSLRLSPRDGPREVDVRVEWSTSTRDLPGLRTDDSGLLSLSLEPGDLRKGERYRLDIVEKGGERRQLCSPEFTFE